MAITKSLPTDFGVNAAHWELTQIVFDSGRSKVAIQLKGWKDAQAKAAGAQPLAFSQVEVPQDISPEAVQLKEDAIELLEAYIGAQSPFTDGV